MFFSRVLLFRQLFHASLCYLDRCGSKRNATQCSRCASNTLTTGSHWSAVSKTAVRNTSKSLSESSIISGLRYKENPSFCPFSLQFHNNLNLISPQALILLITFGLAGVGLYGSLHMVIEFAPEKLLPGKG